MAVELFEAKIEMARNLYDLTELIHAVELRLADLGHPSSSGPKSQAIVRQFYGEESPSRMIALAYTVTLPRVSDALADLLSRLSLADGPTLDVIEQGIRVVSPMLEWGERALILLEGDESESVRAGELRWRKGVLDYIEQDECSDWNTVNRTRPLDARRDKRFITFYQTRDYSNAVSEIKERGGYYADRLELCLINRDEIDAIETFSLVYFDLMYSVPIDMLRDLARTAWDEARHALLGHALLTTNEVSGGLNPFDYPCSMIGITVRSKMGGWNALAQISMFGELNILKPMRQLASNARRRGDALTANTFEYIWLDESRHLKRMRSWLENHHPLRDLSLIEDQTRSMAGRILAEMGVVGEDYYVQLSASEIFSLLGE